MCPSPPRMLSGIRTPPPRPVVYNVGDKVEVIGKEEGYVGSYYNATILSVLEDDRYKVQYESFIEDEETQTPLKDTLLKKDIRPKPPRVRTGSEFKPGQNVDAYDHRGWWNGKIIGDIEGVWGHYCVYYESSNEYVEYSASRIRVHHEFVDGHWLQAIL